MAKDSDRLLTPREVAAMFRVDPKTVTRWAQAGKLQYVRYIGSAVFAVPPGVPSPDRYIGQELFG